MKWWIAEPPSASRSLRARHLPCDLRRIILPIDEIILPLGGDVRSETKDNEGPQQPSTVKTQTSKNTDGRGTPSTSASMAAAAFNNAFSFHGAA